MDTVIAKAVRYAEKYPHGVDVKDYAPGKSYHVRGTGDAHGMGFTFASSLWAYLKQANGFQSGLEADQGNSSKVKSDNALARKFINCTGGYQGVTRKPHVYARYQIGGAFDRNEGSDSINLGNGCNSGEIYLDKDCGFVAPKTAQQSKQQLCGNTKIDLTVSTPLSLVWSASGLSEPSTIVGFKLNPHSGAAQWMWRGSASLPLLVFDPEHTGVIRGAEQLFGSWTFGGKPAAASGDTPAAVTSWRDGYEALATLDKDGDGKVSGAELDPLGLWLDENRDGVSQPGEVKTLAEVSVHTLYYKPDKTEEGAIVATKGYERTVDGGNVVLPSIDWSEKELQSGPGELLERTGTPSFNGLSPAQKEGASTPGHRSSDSSGLFGLWGWTIDDSSSPSPASGYLVLQPHEDGVLGATVSQIEVSGDSKVEGIVAFKHFTGSLGKTGTGQDEVKFSVEVANGALLQNTATLSADGKNLSGKTVVTNSANSTSGSYEYAWKAQRLGN